MKRVYAVTLVPWMLAALFFAVSASAQTSVADVHRWFNPRTGDHFYTTDPRGELAPSSGYRSEGVGFRLWRSQAPGSTLLYRWYNPRNGDHFYTTDPSGELAPRSGYRQEPPLGWILRQQASGTVALHRWYNPQSGDHFYTTDPSGELAPRSGYRPEGVTGYVLPAGGSPPPPPQAAVLSAVYRGMDSDVVGPGSQATPNGQRDGHFSLTLDTRGVPRTVNHILLQSADAQGRPAGGQAWDTQPGGYWILGVYRDGRRLNPSDVNISNPVQGIARYEIYGNDSGWFRPGQNFRITVRFAGGGEAATVAQVGAGPPPPPPAQADLTGVWRGNDGGTYYLRQVGNRLFWLGESGDGGRTWTNVAMGTISGGQINLEWGDVTKGRIRQSGRLMLRIDGPNHLIRTQVTGGFGGSDWRR